jgi:hypothetical protein
VAKSKREAFSRKPTDRSCRTSLQPNEDGPLRQAGAQLNRCSAKPTEDPGRVARSLFGDVNVHDVLIDGLPANLPRSSLAEAQ